MECDWDLEIQDPNYPPLVKFKLKQLNMSICYSENEIEYEINLLHEKVAELGRRAKRELKLAHNRYDN